MLPRRGSSLIRLASAHQAAQQALRKHALVPAHAWPLSPGGEKLDAVCVSVADLSAYANCCQDTSLSSPAKLHIANQLCVIEGLPALSQQACTCVAPCSSAHVPLCVAWHIRCMHAPAAE